MCPDNKETPQSLIADFVLECKGKGSFLPYVDYSIIEEWIKVSQNIDELLLILSDVLPGILMVKRPVVNNSPELIS